MAKHTHLLTQAAVEKTKPGTTRREIPDGGGLYLVIQPSGAKTWAVRYRRDGRPRKLTLGAHDLSVARGLARKALETVAQGGDPGAAKKQARLVAADRQEDFPSVAAKFLKHYVNRKGRRPRPRTLGEMARHLGMLPVGAVWEIKKGGLAHRWRGRKVSDITKGDVISRLDEHVAKGFGASANGLRAVLHLFFGWCVERDLSTQNPCASVRRPADQKTRDRTLDDKELALFWRAASEDAQFGAMIKMLALTGQRRDEARAMTWSELDLEAGIWKIPAARSKNGREHLVPLSPFAVEILEQQPRITGGQNLVFTANGGGLLGGLSRFKRRLDDRMLALARETDPLAEKKPWVIHDLRRTCATGLQRLKFSLPVIEKVLNHTSGSFAGVVGTYQRHDFLDEKRMALRAWAGHIASLTGEKQDNVVPIERAVR